jgi:hypothetical protein
LVNEFARRLKVSFLKVHVTECVIKGVESNKDKSVVSSVDYGDDTGFENLGIV